MVWLKYILLFLSLSCSGLLFATKSLSMPMRPINHSALNDLMVRKIFIDDTKVAWIGTDSGLYRYSNGFVEHLGHDYAATAEPFNGPIVAIYELSNRYLLISGFPNSVSFFDRKQDQFVSNPFRETLNDASMLYLAIPKKLNDNLTLLSTLNRLYLLSHNDHSIRLVFNTTSSTNSIHSYVIDESNNIWLTTKDTLHLIKPPYQTVLTPTRIQSEDTRNQLILDDSYQLHLFQKDQHLRWVNGSFEKMGSFNTCSPQQSHRLSQIIDDDIIDSPLITPESNSVIYASECGISRYDLTTQKLSSLITPPTELIGPWLRNYTFISSDEKLVATQSGLFYLNTNQPIVKLANHIEASNGGETFAIGRISEDQFLVGDGTPGLKLASPFLNKIQGLSQQELERLTGSHSFRDLIKQNNETLWLASQVHGLFLVVRDQSRWMVKRHYFPDTHVRDLFLDGNRLWVATEGIGLHQINIDNGQVSPLLQTIEPKRFLSIRPINEKQLAIGGSYGLLIVDRKNGELIKIIDTLETPDGSQTLSSVWAIASDSQGYIWFASHNANWNLFKLSPNFELVESYCNENSLGEYSIFDMVLDHNEQPVLATWGGGLLYRQDQGLEFQRLTMVHGLPSDTIFSIKQVGENFWVSTDRGLAQIRLCQQVGCEHKVKVMNRNDGLFTNLHDLNSASLNKDGSLIYGGFFGIHWFHPEKDIIANTSLPTAHFWSAIRIDEINAWKKLAEQNAEFGLTIPYNTRSLQLQFHSNDFVLDNKKQYRFRINQGTWQNLELPLIELNYLASGRYQIDAQSSNSDGLWPENMVSLSLKVTPPWWHTYWAYLLYAIMLVLLFLSMLHWRQKQLAQQKAQLKNTVEKRTKELNESYTALENAIREKELMFQNTSHELRTPLQSILSFSQMLSKEVHSVQGCRNLSLVQQESNYLLRKIETILDKAELSINHNQYKVHDVIHCIKFVMDSLAGLAQEREQSVELKVEPDYYPVVRLSVDAERAIFGNLLKNAISYSPKNSLIEIRVAPYNSQVCVSICDEGPGVSNIQSIQQRRVRENTQEPGYGYGLDIVMGAVRLNQGNIEFKNKSPCGFEARVTLPCYSMDKDCYFESSQELLACKGIHNPFSIKKHLLIAEDSPLLQDIFKQYLAPYFQLSIYENARLAQAKLMKDSNFIPDLVISDVMMPEMNGFDFCQWLKSNESLGMIPVILLTAKADQDSKTIGFNCGADLYIRKPIVNFNSFIQQILNLLKTFELRDKLIRDFAKNPRTIPKDESDNEFVSRVFQFIEANYADPLYKIDQLITQLNCSETTFRRQMKANNLGNAKKLLEDYRLEKAMHLLTTTDMKIKEISPMCGYSRYEEMRTKIKIAFGQSPNKIRASALK